MRFLPLLLVPILGLAYTLWHIWSVLPLSNLWRGVVVALYAVAVLSIVLVASRAFERIPTPVATVIYEVGGSGPMVMLYTLMAFLLLDILRLLHVVPRSLLFSNGYTSVIVAVALIATFAAGNALYHRKVKRTLELTTEKGLDRELRIVMASDLHIGYHNGREELARWVDMINAEEPDLVLFAGDIIDRCMRPVTEQDMAAEFRRLKAPAYAALGNHEFYSGLGAAMDFYARAGITLLRDSAATVLGVNVIGRDDRTNRERMPLADLAAGVDPARYTIVMDHQPFDLAKAEEAGVDFQLSGHTHDGQVFPMNLVLRRVYENSHGESSRGATRFYVTSGLGIWGGKFRIGTRSEYVVATLRHE